MTHPTSRITEAQKESPNKARVEAELKALQDKHRLAIHVTEDYVGFHATDLSFEDHMYFCGTLEAVRSLRVADHVPTKHYKAQLKTLLKDEGRTLPLFFHVLSARYLL